MASQSASAFHSNCAEVTAGNARLGPDVARLVVEAHHAPFLHQGEVAAELGELGKRRETGNEHVVVVAVDPDVLTQCAPTLEHLALANFLPAVVVVITVQRATPNGGKHDHHVVVELHAFGRQIAIGIAVGGNVRLGELLVDLGRYPVDEQQPLLGNTRLAGHAGPRAQRDEPPAELERLRVEVAGHAVVRGETVGIGRRILPQVVLDDPTGDRGRLGIAQVGQVGVARAVLVQGQQFGLFLPQGLGSDNRPRAAVAADGEHRLGIHLVPQFPAGFLPGQFGLGVQPPVAHHEIGFFTHLLLRYADRLLPGHDLAEFARHEPPHAQAAEEVVDGVFRAVVGAVVVAGQEQPLASADDHKTLVATICTHTRGNSHAQGIAQPAPTHKDRRSLHALHIVHDG